MYRSALAAALLAALCSSAHAAHLETPPAGDDPTPDGWLLVKIPFGVNEVQVSDPGILTGYEIAFTGFDWQTTYPTIALNHMGQQFWVSTDEPEVSLKHFDARPTGHLSHGHDWSIEVGLGLDQVFLTPGPIYQTGGVGVRFFTVTGAGDYSRTYSVGLNQVLPEPGGGLMATVFCVGLIWLSGRVGEPRRR
jgi:opacity protein-like surface antigen